MKNRFFGFMLLERVTIERLMKYKDKKELDCMANLIEVQLDNGMKIFIEASRVDESDDLLEHVSANKIITKTKEFLTEAFNQVKAFSNGISESISTMEFKPDEFEVEFAVKFSADAGIIISSIGTESSVTVKMKWNKDGGN